MIALVLACYRLHDDDVPDVPCASTLRGWELKVGFLEFAKLVVHYNSLDAAHISYDATPKAKEDVRHKIPFR